jgi:hypothetical protein
MKKYQHTVKPLKSGDPLGAMVRMGPPRFRLASWASRQCGEFLERRIDMHQQPWESALLGANPKARQSGKPYIARQVGSVTTDYSAAEIEHLIAQANKVTVGDQRSSPTFTTLRRRPA